MRLALGVVAAGLLATGAAAQAPQSGYAKGVAARQAGDARTAAAELTAWLAAHPEDVDARLQYGLALLDLGRLPAARSAFEQVLAAAPDYRDARLGLARVEERSGRTAAARAVLARLGPDDAEAAAIRARLDGPQPARSRIDLDAGLSAVEGGQKDWRALAIGFRTEVGSATAIGGQIELTRRFGLTDTYGQFEVEQKLSPGVSVSLLAGGTPNADYRPRWQVGAGARVRLQAGANPTIATFDIRKARFRSGDVTLVRPGVEQYLFGGRAWVTGQVILLSADGRTTSGLSGRIDGEVRPGLRLSLGAADAPDTSEGIVSRVRSLFAGVEAEVAPNRTLRLSVARHAQERGSDRTDLTLGAGVRF